MMSILRMTLAGIGFLLTIGIFLIFESDRGGTKDLEEMTEAESFGPNAPVANKSKDLDSTGGVKDDQTPSSDKLDDSLTPNLIHDRHTHHHNSPHEVVQPNQDRFYTTRSSEIALPLPNEEDAFVFAVFGDRTGGPAEGVNVLADAVRDVNLIEPDLVMTVGDLINGYNQKPQWMEQMNEFKTIMNELLCPWFPVAGNHDVYWRPLNDPKMPRGQHDKNYEMHFGPLWYSFSHKNCNFIVLYSDEGDPDTGEKNFQKPSAQTISEEQFKFLENALERGKKNSHQFIFLHHPRWLGGGYGDDWKKRVHPLLKETGNVTAVFAGHIHYMRYDPQDGIEYVTLATVGGVQSGRIPDAGYLHQYHLITVRPKQVAMAAFPVNGAINVREITKQLQEKVLSLSAQKPLIKGSIPIAKDGIQTSIVEATITNPVDRPIDFTLTPTSADSRWRMRPDHHHGHIQPGEKKTVQFRVRYAGKTLDDSFRDLDFVLGQDYLAPTTRYSAPKSKTTAHYDIDIPVGNGEVPNKALLLDGKDDYLAVDSDGLKLPQGPFTVEAWFNANSFSNRVGLLAKTESSEFSIFLSNGRPSASVHLNGKYRSVSSKSTVPTKKWIHIALVQETQSLALYLNGKLSDRIKIESDWKRTVNRLPFMVGADPDRIGNATSFFHGQIDEIRVSAGALYIGDFTPQRRLEASDKTVLLLNCDQTLGPFHIDRSSRRSPVRAHNGARLSNATETR